MFADLKPLSTPELMELWAATMSELKDRGVVRSGNNPIADYAEVLVARHYGVEPIGGSTAGYDVVTRSGERIQVKALRKTRPGRRTLGAIRRLDAGDFDTLVAVVFSPSLSVEEVWRLPWSVVKRHAVYRAHVNAHILSLGQSVLTDPEAAQLVLGG